MKMAAVRVCDKDRKKYIKDKNKNPFLPTRIGLLHWSTPFLCQRFDEGFKTNFGSLISKMATIFSVSFSF